MYSRRPIDKMHESPSCNREDQLPMPPAHYLDFRSRTRSCVSCVTLFDITGVKTTILLMEASFSNDVAGCELL
jgi:hypothetical protein